MQGVVAWGKVCFPKQGESTLAKIKCIQNNSYVLDYARGMGIVVVNISAEDCSEGHPTAINGLLWQLIKADVTKSLNVVHSFDIVALKEESETVEDFMKQSPATLLLRWVNQLFERSGNAMLVSGVSDEWKDGTLLCLLLKCVSTDFANQEYEQILNQSSEKERLFQVLKAIEKYGLNKKNVTVEPEDIMQGEKSIILSLLSSIFFSCDHSCLTIQTNQDLDHIKNEIFDSAVTMLEMEMPEVKKAEMKSFLGVVKNLSNIDTSVQKERQYEEKLRVLEEHLYRIQQENAMHVATINQLLLQQEVMTNKLDHVESINKEMRTTMESNEQASDNISSHLESVRSDNSMLAQKLLQFKEKHSKLVSDMKVIMTVEAEMKIAENRYGDLTVSNLLSKCPVKVGFMEKQGGKYRNWKKRLFLLFKDFMFYFPNNTATRPNGMQMLDLQYSFAPDNNEKRGKCFSITSHSRTLLCCVETEEERQNWLDTLSTL